MNFYKFDNRTSFDEYNNLVRDWARDGWPQTPAMRVEAHADYVRQVTGFKWSNKRDIQAWFEQEKLKHLSKIQAAAASVTGDFGVYLIG